MPSTTMTHARPVPASTLKAATKLPKAALPLLVTAGAVYGVVSYVSGQLQAESNTMNRMFAQQNTPRLEEARRKNLLTETEGDPRRSLFNILSW